MYSARLQDTQELAREFRLSDVTLELEEPREEQRVYPSRNAEDEKELRFIVTGTDLSYWGHVLVKAGRVHFFNLFPNQEPRAPESYTENPDFQRRTLVISKVIEEFILTGR
jgi:hypothetical protein